MTFVDFRGYFVHKCEIWSERVFAHKCEKNLEFISKNEEKKTSITSMACHESDHAAVSLKPASTTSC